MLAPAVVGRDVVGTLDAPGEQAPSERRVGDEGDPELAAHREGVLRRLPVQERVLHLQRGDRMDGVRPAEGGRRRLAEPERADLALLAQPRHGADGLLDRDLRVHAVLIVEVDRVDSEPFQAGLAGAPDVGGAPVDEVAGAVRAPHLAELGGENDAMPAAGERPPDELLVVPPPVHVGGVQEVDPEIEGAVDHRDGSGVVALSVGPGHRHAAESDRRHLQPVAPEQPVFHRSDPPFGRWNAVSQPTRNARGRSRTVPRESIDAARGCADPGRGQRRRARSRARELRCSGAPRPAPRPRPCGCPRCGTAWPPRRPRPRR